jgi:hypothetical protein
LHAAFGSRPGTSTAQSLNADQDSVSGRCIPFRYSSRAKFEGIVNLNSPSSDRQKEMLFQGRLQAFDDLLCQDVRFRQVFQIFEAIVLMKKQLTTQQK